MTKNVQSYELLTGKAFTTRVKAFEKKAFSVREDSAKLLGHAWQLLAKGDCSQVNELLTCLRTVKTFNLDAFVKFVLFKTGGGTMVDGVEFYDAKKSRLAFDMKTQSFSVKKIDVSKDGFEGTKDEWLVFKKRNVQALQDEFVSLIQSTTCFEWWMFASEMAKNPYKITSLLSAIKKASGELGNGTLTQDEVQFIKGIVDLATDAGYGDKIGM